MPRSMPEMRASLTTSQSRKEFTALSTSRTRWSWAVPSRMAVYRADLMGCSWGRASTQGGRNRSSSFTGNS